jgi:HAE1 family hydrophobic/amphiphilic exporter-1
VASARARSTRAGGAAALEATEDATRLRFRPIRMTSFSFVLGVMPLVFASGAGASEPDPARPTP